MEAEVVEGQKSKHLIRAEPLWRKNGTGDYDLFPLIAGHSKIFATGAGYMLLFVRSPEHRRAVAEGREEVGTIHLHLTAAQCRAEADRLLRCAELLDEAAKATRN
jgi:hypothetical protein